MSRNTRPMTAAEREARTHEPADPDVAAPAPRRAIRSEHRSQMLDLKALANRLAALPMGQRRTLPLDDELQDQLDHLATVVGSDRRRVVMRTKLLLDAVDMVKLEAALAGDTPAAARDRACVQWRTRMIAGGDPVIQAFLEVHPRADRQAIRTSAREAGGEGHMAERARVRLLQLLRESSGPEPTED